MAAGFELPTPDSCPGLQLAKLKIARFRPRQASPDLAGGTSRLTHLTIHPFNRSHLANHRLVFTSVHSLPTHRCQSLAVADHRLPIPPPPNPLIPNPRFAPFPIIPYKALPARSSIVIRISVFSPGFLYLPAGSFTRMNEPLDWTDRRTNARNCAKEAPLLTSFACGSERRYPAIAGRMR